MALRCNDLIAAVRTVIVYVDIVNKKNDNYNMALDISHVFIRVAIAAWR